MEYGTHSAQDIPSGALNDAARELEHFTVSLIAMKGLAGSGTLVRIDDRYGILTARHVWDSIASQSGKCVGINITDSRHRFALPRPHIHTLVVGGEPDRLEGVEIPDLAFMQILDRNAVSSISAKKSFYTIDTRRSDLLNAFPLSGVPCWLVGAPAELTVDHGQIHSTEHTLEVVHAVVLVKYSSSRSTKGHDYIALATPTDDGLPTDYRGVSGGGVWITPFSIDPDIGLSTFTIESPILVGVAFHQSDDHNDERIITAHGTMSIYSRLVETVRSG